MDTWKFYDITHREHVLCNPMSLEKLDRLIGLLRLESGARVLDMASGKGEFVIRLAERYGVSGIGVDISPFFVADARKRLSVRAPGAQLSFVEMEGAKFVRERWESFDLVSCIGASWIFNGHRGTLEFLVRAAAPGGWVVVGEPHWLQDPPEEYLKAYHRRQQG
jgi:cyclopropane fatty-acyl-phospholipid synthase-like methyltransferase